MSIEFKFLFDNDETHRFATELVQNDSCHFRLSRKYRAYYRFLRPIMPIPVRQLLQRHRKVETDSQWYLPLAYMNMLANSLWSQHSSTSPSHFNFGDQDTTTMQPWPNAAQFAFVLTHDIETADGFRNVSRIADLEESLGFRSSWNLVPYKYNIDVGLVNDLKARGFEIGIHGYNHDGQLFSSRRVFERRAVGINAAIEKYGAVGFRAPMVHRNLDWLQSLNVEYDASCFDIDPFQAAPGGVGSIWPFIAGRFVELPYTLPQDHTLFVRLKEQDGRIWKEKLEFLIQHQGMAMMLTHPDYMNDRRVFKIYETFLRDVQESGGYWHATPKEVARWWRERQQRVEFGLTQHQARQGQPSMGELALAAKMHIDELGFRFLPQSTHSADHQLNTEYLRG